MSATRICKVCGAEYEYCHTVIKDGNRFRWQDVACCPEHASVYFKRIAESRGEIQDKAEVEVTSPTPLPTDNTVSDKRLATKKK